MPKPIKEMSGPQINKALDRLDKLDSKFNRAMIKDGRGDERFSEWSNYTDRLSRMGLSLYHMRMDLRNEIARRYGPGAPSRLPKGFGPLRSNGKRVKKANAATAGRRNNPSRSNPSASMHEAEQLSREFHGREPEEIEEYTEVEEYDKNLAKLGDLEELVIISGNGNGKRGSSREQSITPISFENCGVRLAAKGNQLQFVGGDQELNLDELVSEIPELQDQVDDGKNLYDIGEVYSIVYFTDKHHLAGDKSQKDGSSYEHQFSEENNGKNRPRLQYDRRNAAMRLVGGGYKIKPEGIWN